MSSDMAGPGTISKLKKKPWSNFGHVAQHTRYSNIGNRRILKRLACAAECRIARNAGEMLVGVGMIGL